jgi:histidinol-phosphate aminotransferase
MSNYLQRDGVDVRPLWVLPDSNGLAILAYGPNASVSQGSVAIVAEVLGVETASCLVLVELSNLDATDLSELVHGTTLTVATRLTKLPESLDPALACLAPSLGEARRRMLNAVDRESEYSSVSADSLDLPGGSLECERIEGQRLYPHRRVEITASGHAVEGRGRPVASHDGAALSEEELYESLAVLNAYPTQFRPAIETALGRDELARLRPLLDESSERDSRNLNSHSGRVVLRAAHPASRPETEQREIESPGETPPREGSPAARALQKVAAVPAYRQGRSAQGGGSAGKLSSNESPFGPPPAVRAALSAASENLNRYPEEGPVLEQFATYLGIDVERLIFTNGSDELCYLLARLVLNDGSDQDGTCRQGFAVMGEPCYQIDATASTLAGAPIVRVPLIDGAHDLATMARVARQGATLVWLPSPHNPTGRAISHEELVAFLDEVPGDCLVVLDEAYGGYSRCNDSSATLTMNEVRPNLLVQRTFSKDWGLAGLRIGYAFGDAPLIGALRRARPPFSVNAMALAAVSAAIGCDEWRASLVSRIVNERALLESTLEELGVAFFPSEANFVTCALPFLALRDALAAEGLAVRNGADLGLPGWTRITIGWAPQMAALRDVLRRNVARWGFEQR